MKATERFAASACGAKTGEAAEGLREAARVLYDRFAAGGAVTLTMQIFVLCADI